MCIDQPLFHECALDLKDFFLIDSICRWDPNRLANTDDPETLLSKAKLILNKMSLTNFEKLSDEFMSMGLGGSEYLLDKTIDLIVTKAQVISHNNY